MHDHPLSPKVVAEDRRLDAVADGAAEALAAHRWHWTLDETNPDRVPIREYARAVGRAQKAVQVMVHGYAAWREATTSDVVTLPGEPATLHDFRERERLTAERAMAVEAIAAQTGITFGAAAHPGRRGEVDAVLDIARHRAEKHGTPVEDEVVEVAEQRERSRKSARMTKDERAKRHAFRFMAIEGHLGKAYRSLQLALAEGEGVDWPDEERELLEHTIRRVRSMIDLVDLRIAGTTDVNWDAELAKLDEAGAA